MPFAFIGYFLAVNSTDFGFSWRTFLLVIACMILGRNAAMAFNRWADAGIDKSNPRTAGREIPAGVVKPKAALWFVAVNSLLFILAAYFINALCFALSPLVLLVILGYSYTKRFTALSHLVLGLGLSITPIGAYLAVTGKFALLPLLFSALVLCWVAGFDIIYALQDDAFDKSNKLYSIPSKLGRKNALTLSTLLHAICLIFLIWIGLEGKFNFWFWIGAGIFALLLIYQQLLVKPNDLSRVNLAFFTTNGIASVVFAAFVILSLYQ